MVDVIAEANKALVLVDEAECTKFNLKEGNLEIALNVLDGTVLKEAITILGASPSSALSPRTERRATPGHAPVLVVISAVFFVAGSAGACCLVRSHGVHRPG